MADLVELANGFASDLTEVVNGAACTGQSFEATPYEDGSLVWVWPVGSITGNLVLLPVDGSGQPPRLWLKVWVLLALDRSYEHLSVQRSGFALCIDRKTQRPAVRIEYDRNEGGEPGDTKPGTHRRSAAHVHIHGASEELAFAQTVVGVRKLRRLDELHIPVGGRRFRPTLEDFIEFLRAEELVPPLHDGWAEVVERHRRTWLTLQLKAAVRNDPTPAIEQLSSMGYRVESRDDLG